MEEHFLVRASKRVKPQKSHGFPWERAPICHVDKDHELKPLLFKLPQSYFYKGELFDITDLSLTYLSTSGESLACGTLECSDVDKLLALSSESPFEHVKEKKSSRKTWSLIP
jgi:hypothetical protein